MIFTDTLLIQSKLILDNETTEQTLKFTFSGCLSYFVSSKIVSTNI